MKFERVIAPVFGLANLATILAHGPPQPAAALVRREALVVEAAKAYSSCAKKLKSREANDRRDAKTQSFVNSYLESRGLEPSFDKRIDSANATCVLAPEEVEGPYYVSGELIRNDIREKQAGIDLLLDVQLLNVHTCEPLKNVLVDFWSCNSTGVYGGIGIENTLGLTFLRGLVKSDNDGVVQVLTKVPGWYTGRAQHIHVKAHVNYTIANNTVQGGSVVHTGQLYLNQSILSEINVLAPYSADPNPFTLNSADFIFTGEANATAGYDAYIHVTKTGKTLSDGLLGKITLALDPNKAATPVDMGGPGGNFTGWPPGANFTGFPPGFSGFPTGSPPARPTTTTKKA
ncbi:hypothetical protein G7Y89_g13738 [Cudoniella acicularis]|uniref:Intradiol ring-cleavage dioxygenases domain-containing protein n=1 Tax=Cudoniella acicularis TaxID=354080 RepID=A0A8H4VYE0_9HELO|nr:hypothetical protein G7Y89_g13738 [Cudoniella acicularis]